MLADKKSLDLDWVAELATTDRGVLREILGGVVSKNEVYRYNCFRALLQISEDEPLILYPEWDYFVELISSDNSYHRSAPSRPVLMATMVRPTYSQKTETEWGKSRLKK